MRALRVESLGPGYSGCRVAEIACPQPGPGQVSIRVSAAAVNFPDLLQTRGEYQHKPELPFTPGLEAAGEVAALGPGVDDFRAGEVVAGPTVGGAFAEYALASAAALRRPPEGFSPAEAAGFGVAYLTAYVALVRRAQVRPGEWVLVHGAAGGVGLAAVDLGKALGARVIAASSSPTKLATVEAEYAPAAVLDTSSGFRDAVKALTGGRGADVVYDPVGGEVFDESVRCIAFDGRLLSVGFASGRAPVLPVNLALIKGFSVLGVRAGEYGRRFPDKGAENLAAIWAMAEEGRLRPRVHAEYPLEQWREAFETLARREVVGKTIIRPWL
jgi:NADPH2:quinone reductase